MASKRYRLSFADSLAHKPEHPDRTARRSGSGLDMDTYFQVWPNRQSLAKSIGMQQKGATRSDRWRACVALTDGEGY